jgi:hypothetical protein
MIPYTRTGTCVRWGMAVIFVTVSLPKRVRNGRVTSETATCHLDPEVVEKDP